MGIQSQVAAPIAVAGLGPLGPVFGALKALGSVFNPRAPEAALPSSLTPGGAQSIMDRITARVAGPAPARGGGLFGRSTGMARAWTPQRTLDASVKRALGSGLQSGVDALRAAGATEAELRDFAAARAGAELGIGIQSRVAGGMAPAAAAGAVTLKEKTLGALQALGFFLEGGPTLPFLAQPEPAPAPDLGLIPPMPGEEPGAGAGFDPSLPPPLPVDPATQAEYQGFLDELYGLLGADQGPETEPASLGRSFLDKFLGGSAAPAALELGAAELELDTEPAGGLSPLALGGLGLAGLAVLYLMRS